MMPLFPMKSNTTPVLSFASMSLLIEPTISTASSSLPLTLTIFSKPLNGHRMVPLSSPPPTTTLSDSSRCKLLLYKFYNLFSFSSFHCNIMQFVCFSLILRPGSDCEIPINTSDDEGKLVHRESLFAFKLLFPVIIIVVVIYWFCRFLWRESSHE